MTSSQWNYNVPAPGPSGRLAPPPPPVDNFSTSGYYSLVMAAIGGGVVTALLLIASLMRRIIRSRLLLNLERRGLSARRNVGAGFMRGGANELVRTDLVDEASSKVLEMVWQHALSFSNLVLICESWSLVITIYDELRTRTTPL